VKVFAIAMASCCLLGCGVFAPTGPLGGNSFVIENVRVFDGRKDLGVTKVAVRDGLVLAVGDAAGASDLPKIDGTGQTLLPALIDANALAAGRAREDALRFGVATELEMLGSQELEKMSGRESLERLKRERESMARTRQADVFSAGAATEIGDYGPKSNLPSPAKEGYVAELVASRVAHGSDFLKLVLPDVSVFGGQGRRPVFDPGEMAAAVDAAHGLGRLVVVQMAGPQDSLQAVEAGADGVVLFWSQPASAEFVAAARERNAFVISNLAAGAGLAGRSEGPKLLADGQLQRRLSSSQVRDLGDPFEDFEPRPEYWENVSASVKSLHEAGVTVLAGSAAPTPGTAHGIGLHVELDLLVGAGLSPAEALEAATAATAERFSLKDRGRIAPGLRADLLLVEGDPTRDIAATRNIVTVFKNGYAVAWR
jgi:imidazolonepropionase-like amidohydrolase